MQQSDSTPGGPVLEVRNVSKSFAGVKALIDVSLTLRPGEVHALMGENGAGKSTLMKILAGLYPADSGEILLDGRPVALQSPHAAIRNGIVMIHQELMPVPDLTVAENIMLGHEPASRLPGWIDRTALRREARRLLDLLEIDLPVTRKMRRFSVAMMQTVEIARALGHQARVLIMDEPTAAISEREVESLFKAIGMLKDRGAAIVFITHKMSEVFRTADTITVLRDGARVGTYAASELDGQKLIALMVGRPLESLDPRPDAPKGLPALSIHGLSRSGAFHNISFELCRGEILGITGLMGAGRTELASAIFGLAPADAGEIRIAGRPVRIRRPADAMRLGIGMVTEDRKEFGLVPHMSVMHNITLASLHDRIIDHGKENSVADEQIRTFAIKVSGRNQRVSHLSGGNQQKVVIAKALLAEPDILILDEPTRGIDIGAKSEVYAIINRVVRAGKAVLLVSSELPELMALSDRVLVMREGEITAELNPRYSSQEEFMSFAMPA